jgi:MFS family permease
MSIARSQPGAPRRGWQALRGYDRNIYIMLAFTLGKGLQLSIAAITVNLYAYSLGYDRTFIGVLTAVPAIGALIASIPTGILADRIGRKPLLLVGGLLNPLTLLALGLSTAPGWLLFAALLNGVCANAYWVTNLPILTESSQPDQRVGVLAANNFLLLGVGALGSLIGGIVPEYVGHALQVSATSAVPLRWGVLVASFVTFLPAIPLFWLREPRHRVAIATTGETAPESPTTDDEPRAVAVSDEPVDPVGRMALATLFAKLLIPDAVYTTGEAAAIALLALYFVQRFHITPGPLGVYLTVAGLIGGAMSFLAPRMVRRWGKLQTATTSQLLTVPVVLVMGLSPVFGLAYAAELGRNILRGFFEPTYAAFAMEQVSSRYRATLSGFYSVTWSLGFSFGAVLTGWLQDHVNLSAAFLVAAVFIGASALLLRLFVPRPRSVRPSVALHEVEAPVQR